MSGACTQAGLEAMRDTTPPLSATMPPQATEPGREFPFTDDDFRFLRDLVAASSGIRLSDSKRELLYGRVARRLRALGLKSFAEYCERLRRDESGEELRCLINAVTTNLTAFFRERHHFDYLREVLLPAWRQARAGTRRLRFWSAGCSNGAEPYSIAMTVLEAFGSVSGWDIKILATDIDSEVLESAAAGIYADKEIENVPEAWRRRYFLRGRHHMAGRVRVKDTLRQLVVFRQHNLLGPWPMKGPFDAVFCRNVVIYFDKAAQRQIFEGFAQVLADDGHLFIGHSETLFNLCDRFELVGSTIYRKKPGDRMPRVATR